MAKLVLTAVGDDRAGLVTALSSAVADAGGNWLTSQMGRLGGKFAGIVLVELPDAHVDVFLKVLEVLAEGQVFEVTVTPADHAVVLGPGETVSVYVIGNDRPGIVHEVSSALAAIGATILELRTQTRPAPMANGVLFEANAEVRVPPGVSLDAVREAIEAIANDVQVDIAVED